MYQLYQAGANDIVREMFDSSLRAGRYVLENMGLTDGEAARIEQFFFKKDREGLRELASLWDPAIPVSRNAAYVARAKELNAELETALVSHLDDGERSNPETVVEAIQQKLSEEDAIPGETDLRPQAK